jgi:NAD(P)-dependent dehydrogenase (short-subunit alcohol dehydrogenase family)
MEDTDVFGLKGKVALVAGGGAAGDGIGNGRAAAILLARAGARVMVADRKVELARRTVEMIKAEGGDAMAIGVDITDESECKRLVAETASHFGGLDLLDNNVGIGSRGDVTTMSETDWQRVMRINVDAMFLLSKHVIPVMRARGGGAIVNVSSISALRPRGLTAYSVSKGAVITLSKAMAVDHGREGIRVNCVAPGPVYTPMVQAPGMSDEAREMRRKASVLGVEGTGWDVGMAVRFLLSSQANYITGQTLVVDGGVTLRAPSRDSAA